MRVLLGISLLLLSLHVGLNNAMAIAMQMGGAMDEAHHQASLRELLLTPDLWLAVAFPVLLVLLGVGLISPRWLGFARSLLLSNDRHRPVKPPRDDFPLE